MENTISSHNSCALLIVEDDRAARTAICTYFRSLGYDVTGCAAGEQAVEFFEPLRPTIAIIDWQLAGDLDGTDLIRILQRRSADIRCVLITSHDLHELRRQAADLAVDELATKPVSLLWLRDVVKRLDVTHTG